LKSCREEVQRGRRRRKGRERKRVNKRVSKKNASWCRGVFVDSSQNARVVSVYRRQAGAAGSAALPRSRKGKIGGGAQKQKLGRGPGRSRGRGAGRGACGSAARWTSGTCCYKKTKRVRGRGVLVKRRRRGGGPGGSFPTLKNSWITNFPVSKFGG
jgi:hypothetical protein